MSQPGLVESINLAAEARYELLLDMEATNSPYRNDFIPLQDDLAKWLRENNKFQQLDDGTWAVSRTHLHDAIRALGNGSMP